MTDKKIPVDLEGFAELLEENENKKPTTKRKDLSSHHELLTFLERDSERIGKIINLYEEKCLSIKTYPQDTALIIQLENDIIEKKISVIQKLSYKDSRLTTNLSLMLSKQFKNTQF